MNALDGIHHITLISGDAARNVDFYARVLGLRLVKRSVNQDDPTVYHLFYSDERGSPGADITFFEYPHAAPGRAGAGMIRTIRHRVGAGASLDFWEQRLSGEGVQTRRDGAVLAFSDPEGVEHELVVDSSGDPALRADSLQVPHEHALLGFDGVRALVADLKASELMLGETLGLRRSAERTWIARGATRGSTIELVESEERGRQGAGSVHHIAWSVLSGEQPQWRERVIDGGGRPTPIIDRFYFESVYFREPSGILFELATLDGAGFAIDEPAEHLGERLSLPPDLEHERDRAQSLLRPLPDITRWRPAPVER